MSYYHFADAVIFLVSGKDSERYLHARLTNNLKTLKVGASCLAACLSPQGKTQGVYRVCRLEDQVWLLFSLAGNAEVQRQQLACFIVADRVEVKDVANEYRLFGTWDGSFTELATMHFVDAYLGMDLVIVQGDAVPQSCGDSQSLAEFDIQRIKRALPEFPSEIRVDSLFPESGMMQAISNTKGCYAGQEVVERVIALGKLPAVIMAFSTDQVAAIADDADWKLTDLQGASAGSVLKISYDHASKRYWVFARVLNRFWGQALTLINNQIKLNLSPVKEG